MRKTERDREGKTEKVLKAFCYLVEMIHGVINLDLKICGNI